MRTYYPGGSSGGLARIRENIRLIGPCDSVNRVFEIPEPAQHDPPRNQVKLYHGGRRLHPMEYQVFESIPGSGYDRVLLVFAPNDTNMIYADYVLA